MTLIDTPGIASLSTDVSARTDDVPHARRRPGHAGRRRPVPDAPPARAPTSASSRRSTTRSSPSPRRSTPSPCCRGPTRSAVGRLDAMESAAAHRRALPRRPQGPAAVPDRRAGGRAAGPVGRDAAGGRVPARSTPAHGAPADDAEALLLSADRFVQADDVGPAHADRARAPARPASGCSACGWPSR